MKAFSYLSIAFTIVGAFIGAGFVSGQELWQFFGEFGVYGFWGLLIAVILISYLTFVIIKNAVKTNSHTFESLITQKESPIINKSLILIEALFYFCIYVIMTAGAESLISDTFGLNKTIVGIIFAAIVTVISIMGVKWLMTVFSATVPILTASVLIIAILLTLNSDLTLPKANENLFSTIFSAIVFVSYNFIAGIGVFAALSMQLKSKKKLAVSCIMSCVFLFVIGAAILLSIFFYPDANGYDLPMIAVVNSLDKTFGTVYSILLILAMLGASLASFFPIADILKKNKKKQILICTSISILCVTLSSFGFKELISTIYPTFGYIGFVVIALVLYNNFKREA